MYFILSRTVPINPKKAKAIYDFFQNPKKLDFLDRYISGKYIDLEDQCLLQYYETAYWKERFQKASTDLYAAYKKVRSPKREMIIRGLERLTKTSPKEII